MPLYALGSNSAYQLSLAHTDDVASPSETPLVLPKDTFPAKIVAGSNHTLVLTNKGTLYTTGGNKYGQCLKPECDYVPRLELVADKWLDIAATWEGTIGIKEDGSLWTFGRIRDCENLLGWEGFEVKHVYGGVQHFVIHSCSLSKEELIGFGDGRKGQFGGHLGNNIRTDSDYIRFSDPVRSVACGKEFTCLLVENVNPIQVCTNSEKHNIRAVPPLDDVHSVAASWSTIAVLHNSGKITAWGRNDRGQFPPESLPPIKQLAAGSEHFIALSKDDRVYAWGWNEHGNCGKEDRTDVTDVHELVFPDDEIPTYVAAGCGTSWIWTEKRSERN